VGAIDLDRVVTDTVHLQSLPGAVERLVQQCHDIAAAASVGTGEPALTNIRRVGDAVVLNLHGPLRTIAELRMYSACSIVLGDHAENQRQDYAAAVAALRASTAGGVLSAVPEPAAAARRFRVDPLPDRWELRDRVTEALGWVNDPRDWLVNLSGSGVGSGSGLSSGAGGGSGGGSDGKSSSGAGGGSGGLLLAQVGPLYHSRRFPALRRVPASTNPVIAALLAQLLKVRPGDVVYDPFCGAGTLLVEVAALDVDAVLLGSDVSWSALAEAVGNRAVLAGRFGSVSLFQSVPLFRADAGRLPVATDSVDRLVSNLPFGKRVGSHSVNVKLYPAFLAELSRVLRIDGRAVLLTDDKNLLRRSVQATPGTRILREVQVATGGNELHPTAFVLERTRTARRSAKRVRGR
jgi:SAM-dependent methyltransferase